MEDLDLPEIKRKKVQEKKAEDKKEFKDLFQSDSDSDDDDGLRIKGKLTVEKLFNLRESPMPLCPLGGSVCHRLELHGEKTHDKWGWSKFSAFICY